ncbi:hypothetical protein [Demequina litorisediminis]|uniref:Uncharacterized protein n=1 Tax=Demequina litorisediminis TaxID=1849022 RepID=A0ABQ6IGB5_9MICO|nr:hypothetical protein [Demequina litorisediminis]GMA36908.1 hypothetical protein GCM10025876_31120 [Demequina litorisediminis]
MMALLAGPADASPGATSVRAKHPACPLGRAQVREGALMVHWGALAKRRLPVGVQGAILHARACQWTFRV